MLFRFLRPPKAGRLLRPYSTARRALYSARPSGFTSHVSPAKVLGQDGSRCHFSSTSSASERDHSDDIQWIDTRAADEEDPLTDSSAVEYKPWWSISESGQLHKKLEPLSFFELLSRGVPSLSSLRLRGLAAATFPDRQRKTLVPPFLLPDVQETLQALATHKTIGLTTYVALDIPKQLLSAQILSFYTGQKLLSQDDWAQCLFKIAIDQYRALEVDLEAHDPSLCSTCYHQFFRLLDLLRLWNLFFHIHQPARHGFAAPLRETIEHTANEMPSESSYQHKLFAFAPKWQLGCNLQSDQRIVFSSFITLSVLVKIRYRLLSCFGRSSDVTGVSAGHGSFLNLRNVSVLEATFMHTVARAAQSAPLNRIYMRLGFSQLGFTSRESEAFGRTVEYLHDRYDYLLMEAERCFTLLPEPTEARKSVEGKVGPGERVAREPYLDQGRYDLFLAEQRLLAPSPILYWIEGAGKDELATFRQTLFATANESIVEVGVVIFEAVTRRALALAQRSSSQDSEANDLSRTLTAWFDLSASGPSPALANVLLTHFRNKDDIFGFISIWTALLRYQRPMGLLDNSKAWLIDLWRKGHYEQALKLHREVLSAIRNQTRRIRLRHQPLALRLTHEALSLCAQGPPLLSMARKFLGHFLSAGFSADRHMWRLLIRLNLSTGSSSELVNILQRYNETQGELEDLDQECLLFFQKQVRLLVADKRTPVRLILTIISRSVRVWHGESPHAIPYFEEPQKFGPQDAWERFMKAHSYLLMHVCDSATLPNKLKVAACIHKHLLDCVTVEHLPPPLALEITNIEERIERLFWNSHIDDQRAFLCRHLYSWESQGSFATLPILRSRKLVAKWLVQRLKSRGVAYDLGQLHFDDLGSYLRHVLKGAFSGTRAAASAEINKLKKEIETAESSQYMVEPARKRLIWSMKKRLLEARALEHLHFQMSRVHAVEREVFTPRVETPPDPTLQRPYRNRSAQGQTKRS